MPFILAVAASQESSWASSSVGNASLCACWCSSAEATGSVMLKGLCKFRLPSAYRLPPATLARTLDNWDDSDHWHAEAFQLSRTTNWPPQNFHAQREQQAENKPRQGASGYYQRPVGPVWLIWKACRFDERQTVGALFTSHACGRLRIHELVGDILVLRAKLTRLVFQLSSLLEDRGRARLTGEPCIYVRD